MLRGVSLNRAILCFSSNEEMLSSPDRTDRTAASTLLWPLLPVLVTNKLWL